MKEDDAAMLAAYDEAMLMAARVIKALGGDPAKPTKEQAKFAAALILEHAAASGFRPTVKQLMADHRKIVRLRNRRSV